MEKKSDYWVDILLDEVKNIPDNDMQKLYANIDKVIIISQKKYEQAIEVFKEASHQLGVDTRAYREAKRERTRFYHLKEFKVSIIEDLVNGDTAKEKEQVMKTKGTVDQCIHLIRAYESRVNAMKFIGKKTENIVNKH